MRTSETDYLDGDSKPGRGQHRKYLPYAFTEHGAIRAATPLNSPRATALSIYLVRAFVALRGLLSANKDLHTKVHAQERKGSVHERKLAELADSMAALLATPAPPRERSIGFINPEDKGKKASSQAKSKTRPRSPLLTLAALTIQMSAMTISDDERTLFAGLGERVAQLRKARSITQVQLADALGVSQQTVQAYEVGRRRIPVSTLRLLAKTLDVSLDELMAEGEHAPRKRGPVPQVQRQLERISALPKPKQRAVMDVIEALLAQQGR